MVWLELNKFDLWLKKWYDKNRGLDRPLGSTNHYISNDIIGFQGITTQIFYFGVISDTPVQGQWM